MTQPSSATSAIRALLAIITVVVGFAALKVTQPVTLPLAFAVVLLLFSGRYSGSTPACPTN